jgi:hypothetical protein
MAKKTIQKRGLKKYSQDMAIKPKREIKPKVSKYKTLRKKKNTTINFKKKKLYLNNP